MLASITPLGERGRHSHYPVTAVAFALGATAAGAGTGLLLGAIGGLVDAGVAIGPRLAVLAVSLLVAIWIDLRPGAAPGPRRQVNEQWLHRYRGWVYGLGFGAQMGVGVGTIVTSAATYVALLAAVLSAGAGPGALIVGLYGALRGATVLLTARTDSPARLVALHTALARARPRVDRAALGLLTVGLIVALLGAMA